MATAYLKTYGKSDETISRVQQWIEPCLEYMEGDGMGQMCELFDGDPPHAPRGRDCLSFGRGRNAAKPMSGKSWGFLY